MIITRLMLYPFGCFSKKEIVFSKGLNVILGPNEAGKSTAFHGLQKVLFAPSKLTIPQYRSERMERYCPLDGDTMRVELSFIRDGNVYTLSKSWGGTKSAKLTLPSGSLLTDDAQITEELDRLFPATPGTFKSVLMTYQSGLGRTLEELNTDHADTVRGLGDILRKAEFETDGVSIEQFKQKVLSSYNDYFDRWNRLAQYPEKGKGIENRWTNKVGLILETYYKKEAVAKELDKTKNLEETFDIINGKIKELSKTISEQELYIQENSKIVEGVRERRTLNAEKTGIQAKMDVLVQVNSDWPVRESKIQEHSLKVPELNDEVEKLDQEKKAAEEEEKNRTLRDRFKKVSEIKENLDGAERGLGEAKKLGKEDLEKIIAAHTLVERLKTEITASKLSITITAVNNFGLSITRDLDPTTAVSLSQGGIQKVDAGGLVRLEHPDWHMEITSGKGNIQELLDGLNKAEKQLMDILKQHGVANVDEGREVNRVYEQLANEVKTHGRILNVELGGDSFEELRSQVNALGSETTQRPLVDIITELERTKAKKEQLEQEIRDNKNRIDEYLAKYGDKTKLLLELAEYTRQAKQHDEKLEGLPPLPPGVDDPDAYIKQYEKVIEACLEAKGKRESLMIERARMEGEMPEVSAEELERQLAEAEAEFNRVKRKGEAIARISDITEKVLAELDSGSDTGLKKDVEKYIADLTGERYDTVAMDKTLPHGIVRKDGKTLPYGYLSAGTKDVFSLALRLAMANHFLEESKGFIVMDDPLVDLDPDRQKRAADLFKAYANHKQVIIFTCHPSHAELLGGNLVKLSE